MFAKTQLLFPLLRNCGVLRFSAAATGGTLFEKIANKSIPSEILFEDDVVRSKGVR